METKLKRAFLAQDSTPLSFLISVMNDVEVTPQQRMRAAKAAARYQHVPGQADTSAFVINDPFGFSCDVAIAKEIRQCRQRLRYINRLVHGISYRQYTAADIEETRIIRKRLAELKAGLKYCPTYQKADRSNDDDRMAALNKKNSEEGHGSFRSAPCDLCNSTFLSRLSQFDFVI